MIRSLEYGRVGIGASCAECGEYEILASERQPVLNLAVLRAFTNAHALCVPQSVRLDEMKEGK